MRAISEDDVTSLDDEPLLLLKDKNINENRG